MTVGIKASREKVITPRERKEKIDKRGRGTY